MSGHEPSATMIVEICISILIIPFIDSNHDRVRVFRGILDPMLGIHLDKVTTQKSAIKAVQEALAKKVFLHIVSLNPENIISAQGDHRFSQILNTADIQIIDGTGVLMAS